MKVTVFVTQSTTGDTPTIICVSKTMKLTAKKFNEIKLQALYDLHNIISAT